MAGDRPEQALHRNHQPPARVVNLDTIMNRSVGTSNHPQDVYDARPTDATRHGATESYLRAAP